MPRQIHIQMTPDDVAFAAQFDPNEAPPKPAAPPPGRLTVVERVYHETGGDKVTDAPFHYEEVLTSEQPKIELALLVRPDTWQCLPSLPFVKLALLTVANKPPQPTTQPTENDRPGTLLISFGHKAEAPKAKPRTQWDQEEPEAPIRPDIEVPPGQSARFRPCDWRNILLAAEGGPARCAVTLYPG